MNNVHVTRATGSDNAGTNHQTHVVKLKCTELAASITRCSNWMLFCPVPRANQEMNHHIEEGRVYRVFHDFRA